MSSTEESDSCSVSSSLSNGSTSSDGSEMVDDEGEGNVIRPWRFEPVSRRRREAEGENNNSEDDDQQERLENSEWCTCENCQIMDRAVECKCCQEIAQVKVKLREAVEVDGWEEEPACITSHPGFLAVCTNRWVLQAAWYQYRQHYGGNAGEIPLHKRIRHIAYRQLVRWCWGILGKEIRVVLPSCAVMCIRAHFPPPGLEEDFVFAGFKYADE